ncbi:unnamed protein product [Cladocopium goreaui]|uniref:Protein disulfide-isomerase 1 (PDI1) n=1 Tax=Cladocopium goreaui TaxID=2562237 RepID=A0A9P1FHV1_9DINO|nr:unnamed protein product [Cladocopium goreaui]
MIWGEAALEEIDFHFCLIASGCNFNQFSRYGTSPWFPVIHQVARQGSELDERFLESRRRTILREHQQLTDLNLRKASVLVVGAGYQAVQWACELNYFFPSLRVFLADFMPRCLGPLPEDAAAYCEDYMRSHGISTQYNVKYDENSEAFWQRIGLPERADRTYVLSGAKHSNYFVDEAAQSQRGPGGGGWILVNQFLQVVTKTGERWGGGNIFAVGDCVSSSGEASKWDLPQLPKTGFPAEQQAMQAARNIKALDRRWFAKRCLGCVPREGLCSPWHLRPTWFPWAAGIFAISLGPEDGVVIVGAKYEKGSGRVYCRGALAAAIKVNLCAADWPESDASKLYLVMFHSSRCGHCQSLRPLLQQLASGLDGVTVAGVECPEESNRQLCRRYNVTGYPTLYAIGQGHEARYKGGASDAELRRFLRTLPRRRLGRCASAPAWRGVVRLCREHFPEADAKHPWLVLLYRRGHRNTSPTLSATWEAVAKDLANGMTRERLDMLAEKYQLHLSPRAKLQSSSRAKAAKLGAVCCDCGEEAFCERLLKTTFSEPKMLWASRGKVQASSRSVFDASQLVEVALGHLGYLSQSRKDREDL